MIHIIKQKGLYQKRSTPASFPPVTVKWTIEDNREAGSVSFHRLHSGTVLGHYLMIVKETGSKFVPQNSPTEYDNTSVSSTTKGQGKKFF